MEVSTTPGETIVDTPSAVSMRTPERGSARSGTTTQGWRPISVKIQPDVQAAKGSHIVHSAAMPRWWLLIRRLRRVSHRASAPMATEAVPAAIMNRKDQKAVMTSGV